MTLEDHAKEIALTIITKLTNNPKETAIYYTAFGFDVKAIIDNGLIYYFFTGMPCPVSNMIGSIFESFNQMLKDKWEAEHQKKNRDTAPIKKSFTKIKYRKQK